MEKLKNKIFIVLFFTNSFFVYSQEMYKSNLILLVDNVIITDNITMEFVNEKNEVQSNFNYSLGKEMIVSSELFGKQDLFLKFNYFGELNGLPK